MGRKNSQVRRANAQGRLARRQKGEGRINKQADQRRIRVEEMVLPDGQCEFQSKRPKARFATEARAAKALAQAQRQRARIGSGHVEKRYYACPEGGCGGYHLTSRETFDVKPWQDKGGNS